MNWLKETILEGETVKLIPLNKEHKQGLLNAATDGNLWKLWYTTIPSEETVDSYLNYAFTEKNKGTAFPFVVIHKENNQIIVSGLLMKS